MSEKGDGAQETAYVNGKTRSHAVHAVEEIKGIGDSDHPHDGKYCIPHGAPVALTGQEREHSPAVDEDDGKEHLCQEPEPCRYASHIVCRLQDKKNAGAHEHSFHMEFPDIVCHEGGYDACKDGQPAQSWGWPAMDFSAIRPIHGSCPECHPL